MRPIARLVLAAVVVAAAGPVLSACDSLDTMSELWDSKKKLAGERKPVFPDGVPGVSTGVPAELVKGYREPEGGGLDPAKAAAEAAAETPAKTKKPAPERTASKPAPKRQPAPSNTSAAAPAQQAAPQTATAPWPAQQAAPQTATAPWPSAQPQAAWPSGSTTR